MGDCALELNDLFTPGNISKSNNDIQNMTDEVHEWAEEKGWWDDGRTFGDHIALVHSELSEALEAFREHKMEGSGGKIRGDFVLPNGQNSDTYWEKPEGVPSELADVLVRLLHMCGFYGIDLGEQFRLKMDYNWTRTFRHGGKAL